MVCCHFEDGLRIRSLNCRLRVNFLVPERRLPKFNVWFLGRLGTWAPRRCRLPTPVVVEAFFLRLGGGRGHVLGCLGSSPSDQTTFSPSKINNCFVRAVPCRACRLTIGEYLSTFGETLSCFRLTDQMRYSPGDNSRTSSPAASSATSRSAAVAATTTPFFLESSFNFGLFGGADKSSSSKSLSDDDMLYIKNTMFPARLCINWEFPSNSGITPNYIYVIKLILNK